MSETSQTARVVWWLAGAVGLLLAFCAGGVLTGGAPQPSATTAEADQDAVWTCSMHPQVRSAEPGKCPLCGMNLILASSGGNTSMEQVTLSERGRVLAQLRTTEVRRQADSSAQLRLLGRIEPAESTRRNVTTWIGGRIDRLNVNTTGERVRRGQTTASLYSPEVYSAH